MSKTYVPTWPGNGSNLMAQRYARSRQFLWFLKNGGIDNREHLAAIMGVKLSMIDKMGAGSPCKTLPERPFEPSNPLTNGGHLVWCEHCNCAIAKVPCFLCWQKGRKNKLKVVVRVALASKQGYEQ